MATRRLARDDAGSVLRISDELAARLVHRDYRARPSRVWSLVEVGGPSLRLVLTMDEAERLRDALGELLRQVPTVEAVPLFGGRSQVAPAGDDARVRTPRSRHARQSVAHLR